MVPSLDGGIEVPQASLLVDWFERIVDALFVVRLKLFEVWVATKQRLQLGHWTKF